MMAAVKIVKSIGPAQYVPLFYTDSDAKDMCYCINCKFDVDVLMKRFQDANYFW